MPLVLTGDLNSTPDSSGAFCCSPAVTRAVYEFLRFNRIRTDHQDLLNDEAGILETIDRRHSLSLNDGYAILENRFVSNYTNTFAGIIDYIWHPNTMRVSLCKVHLRPIVSLSNPRAASA